jgi:hypothetical protein
MNRVQFYIRAVPAFKSARAARELDRSMNCFSSGPKLIKAINMP